MFSGNDAGDQQTTQDASDAALPRGKHVHSSPWGWGPDYHESPKEREARRKREDKEWADKCGPVTVRKIGS